MLFGAIKSSAGFFVEFEDYTLVVGDDELSVNEPHVFGFNYFPNPVQDILYLNTHRKITSVEIFNAAGQTVLHPKMIQGQVDVSKLPSGTYLFRVLLENNQIESFKIIKK